MGSAHRLFILRLLSPFLPNLTQEQSDLEVLEQYIRREIYRGKERKASSGRKYPFSIPGTYVRSHSQRHSCRSHANVEHRRHTPNSAWRFLPEAALFSSATSRFASISNTNANASSTTWSAAATALSYSGVKSSSPASLRGGITLISGASRRRGCLRRPRSASPN